MSLANEKDVLKLQQLGKQYAKDALTFFGKNYSQKPEIQEVAVFYATATAALAETMYAFMAANAERDQADGWLVQLFATISQSLQTKRIPVPAAPGPAVEESPEPAGTRCSIGGPRGAPGTVGIPKCICILDPKGFCPACPPQLKASVRKVLLPVGECLRVIQEGLRKVGAEKSCPACTETYLDAAVASVLMEGSLGELPPELEPFADQVFEAIYEWAGGRGVGEMALTEKAWAIFSDRMADKDPAAKA